MSGYFEDYAVGQRDRFGEYVVTREEVLDFASRYDPQPFHLSDTAAAATHFGSLAASGWHSCSMFMAMMVRHMQSIPGAQDASLGAIGIDELRWLRPVHPGDVLHCEVEILDKKESQKRPEMGVIDALNTLLDQDDVPVMRFKAKLMVKRRPSD